MPETKMVKVSDLSLDLNNFRTVSQPDEVSAINAMISASPDRFGALTLSLLEDGYLPTESIIVLRDAAKGGKLVVKEGNRRIAALKFAHKLLPTSAFSLPENVANQIASLSDNWRRENNAVPCTIYDETDSAKVDRIVSLAHGKGERAGRDQWNAIARARHNRAHGRKEPALDLLEKYFENGRNITATQKGRWAGAYPLTVLEDAMKRLAPRLGYRWSKAIAEQYLNTKYRDALDAILHDISAPNGSPSHTYGKSSPTASEGTEFRRFQRRGAQRLPRGADPVSARPPHRFRRLNDHQPLQRLRSERLP